MFMEREREEEEREGGKREGGRLRREMQDLLCCWGSSHLG